MSEDEATRQDSSLAYFEWCAPDPAEACEQGADCDHGKQTPGCGADKPELWQEANPAMGVRITEKFIRNERRTLPVLEFIRERLGWWDDPITAGEPPPIDPDRWAVLVDSDPDEIPDLLTTFAIEVDRDQAFASVGTAGERSDGRIHLEVVKRGRGTKWVVAYCVELDDAAPGSVFVVDGGGPAERLIEDLEAEGLYVLTAGTGDVSAATGAMIEMVADGTAAPSPQQELADAVKGARKRYFRDGGFTFGRAKSETDVTPLVAVTLAAWGLTNQGGTNVW